MKYTFLEHKHRFAGWCGASAAGASPKSRFKVSQGVNILNNIKITDDVENKIWEQSGNFDFWHTQTCKKILEQGIIIGIKGFSYGVAAKMLNCYIKAFWIGDEYVLSIAHPPIDRILLESLERGNIGDACKFWRKYKLKGWSTFSEDDYAAVIEKIRICLSDKTSFWTIEEYWQGFQN